MKPLLTSTILLFSLGVSASHADDLVGPRQACWFDIRYYFQFDDQRAIAKKLRSDCAQCEMDVRWDSPNDPTVLLGDGPITPDLDDRRLFARATSLVAQAHPDSELICIVKANRNPTIEEMVEFMEMGVRFYRSIPHYAYIVRVSAETAVALEGREPVEWVGELRPYQKFPQSKTFDPERPLEILAMAGDRPECRTDLERLGGRVMYFIELGRYEHRWSQYVVAVDPSRLNEIASLWWVHGIQQSDRIAVEQ